MKKIIVITTYSAYVPEDMTVTQVQDQCEKEVRDRLEDFRIYVEDYPNESEAEPLFNLDDVMVGTESMISIGGD